MIPESCPLSNKERFKVVMNLKCKLQGQSAVEFQTECKNCSFNYYNYQKKIIERLISELAKNDKAPKKIVSLSKARKK
jgi:hypothetical protein